MDCHPASGPRGQDGGPSGSPGVYRHPPTPCRICKDRYFPISTVPLVCARAKYLHLCRSAKIKHLFCLFCVLDSALPSGCCLMQNSVAPASNSMQCVAGKLCMMLECRCQGMQHRAEHSPEGSTAVSQTGAITIQLWGIVDGEHVRARSSSEGTSWGVVTLCQLCTLTSQAAAAQVAAIHTFTHTHCC